MIKAFRMGLKPLSNLTFKSFTKVNGNKETNYEMFLILIAVSLRELVTV